MERWQGRVALVTGASSGIGAAITRALVHHGMVVIGCARNLQALQNIRDELASKAAKGRLVPITCDLRKEADIAAMFVQIEAEVGGADVCINNAGVGYSASLMEGTNEHWREMIDVNVMALTICTREALRSMKKRNVDDGHVIHISSMSGHRLTDVQDNFYAATKQAVRAMTDGLRTELVQRGSHIRVTSISPGNVATDFFNRMWADSSPEVREENTKQSFEYLRAEDIVDATLFALSAPPRCEIHDILMRPTEQLR